LVRVRVGVWVTVRDWVKPWYLPAAQLTHLEVLALGAMVPALLRGRGKVRVRGLLRGRGKVRFRVRIRVRRRVRAMAGFRVDLTLTITLTLSVALAVALTRKGSVSRCQ